MEPYVTETAYIPGYYGELKVIAYAPQHYFSRDVMPDRYCYYIVRSKEEEDLSDYFMDYLMPMYNALRRQGLLGDFDLMTVMPSSKMGKYSVTLAPLCKKFSAKAGTEFEFLLNRTRDLPSSGKGRLSLPERFKRVSGSLAMARALTQSERRILLIDDTKTTGCSCLEAAKVLREAGATEIIELCLGINRD